MSHKLDKADAACRVTDKPAEAVTGAPLAEAAEEAMVAAGGDPADGPTPEEEAEAEAKVNAHKLGSTWKRLVTSLPVTLCVLPAITASSARQS